jgi:hypothetical protein
LCPCSLESSHFREPIVFFGGGGFAKSSKYGMSIINKSRKTQREETVFSSPPVAYQTLPSDPQQRVPQLVYVLIRNKYDR